MNAELTRRVWLSGLAGSAICAAADWKKAKFPAWDDDTVLDLLVDSPWAHTRPVKLQWYGKREAERTITYKDVPGTRPGTPASSTVQGGSPVGGIGSGKVNNILPDSARLIFRWASALPVRQAKALYRARQDKEDDAKAAAMVEARAGSDYAFEIFGLPTVAAHAGTEAISALLTRSAAIRTKAGRLIRASRTQTDVAGDVLTSAIYFPREEPIVDEDREIEVLGDVELFSFGERFKLRDMHYLDALEL